MKEEVSLRKGFLTAAHSLSELCSGRRDIQCLLGEQRQIGKSNNRHFCFIICYGFDNISSVNTKSLDHLLEKEIIKNAFF